MCAEKPAPEIAARLNQAPAAIIVETARSDPVARRCRDEEIAHLAFVERMATMELLWKSFAKENIVHPLPDWDAPVLASRSQIIDSVLAVWLSVDGIRDRLMNRRR